MNLQLSTTAWAAIGCLAGVVLLSGAVLWASWRQGMHTPGRSSPFEKFEAPNFNRPWEKEDTQFAELARVASDLRANRHDSSVENKTRE
jgi:hypothetical protein